MNSETISRKIHALPDDLINKIAAGEVIENPAAIVKEMIENAIDARAKKIRVQIEEGGKTKIVVADDGEGMSEADLGVCYLRHTTSKISEADDLFRLKTNGFRGEAIASIAAVSKLSITTRRKEDTCGHSLKIIGGKPSQIQATASSVGTTFLVEDLFFNTPVRRDFLKSTSFEGGKILDTVVRLAIARPEIRFEYFAGEKEVFIGASSELRGRVAEALGGGIAKKMLEVDYEENGIHVEGLIAPREEPFKKRGAQYLYLHKRPIWNAMMARAAAQAYDPYAKGFPVCVLFLSMPEDKCDVNVHPSKREVRFAEENEVFLAVRHAVALALRKEEAMGNRPSLHIGENFQKGSEDGEKESGNAAAFFSMGNLRENFSSYSTREEEFQSDDTFSKSSFEGEENFSGKIYQEPSQRVENARGAVQRNAFEPLPDLFTQPEAGIILPMKKKDEPLQEAPVFSSPQFLQVANTYMVCEDARGILVIDQNAAHARVLYERALRMMNDQIQMDSQELLFPELLELSSLEKECLERSRKNLEQMGFFLEPFGETIFQLRAVPAGIPIGRAESSVRECLQTIWEESNGEKFLSESFAKAFARARAYRAGDTLSQEDMAHLMTQLLQTDEPAVSPFGRPTMLRLTEAELLKKFKR